MTIVATVALIVSAAAPTSAAGPNRVRKPSASKRLPFDDRMAGADRKVALHAFDLLWDAAESNDWRPVQERTRLLLASRVVAGPWEPKAVACLAYCALFAEYVPSFQRLKLSGEERREFQRWLLVNPRLTRRFLFALTDADVPCNAVSVLYELGRRNAETVARCPDLAVAMAIVFDDDRTPPDEYAVTFDWLSGGRGSLAYDVAVVPHEVARYLVGVKVSPAERAWAFNRYRAESDLDDVYHDVEYDRDALTGKRPKNISGKYYTLMNLHAYGGTCGDQAYYAAQVGRILGFPVAEIQHSGPGIIGHCWCLQLLPGRGGFFWQEVGGEGFGWIVDPATGRTGSDQMLAFLLQSLNVSDEQRDVSAALAQVALRIPEWVRIDLPAGPEELIRLAAPENSSNGAEPKVPYFLQKRDLEPVAVLQSALSVDPFNTSAWVAVESLGQRGQIAPAALAGFMSRLEALTGRRLPDVLHFAVMKVASRLPPADAIRFLDAAWKDLTPEQIRRSPKLAGDLLITVADLYAQDGQPQEALSRYESAIAVSAEAEYVPTVIRALEKALPIARRTGQVPRFVHACEAIFEDNKDPRFGLEIGRVLHGAGLSQRAVLWLRYVYDRTKRDTPGRYDSLRLAVTILAELQEYAHAAQWCAELYDTTLHPADGQMLVGLLQAMGRDREAQAVMLRVQQIEYQRRQQVEADAAKRAQKN